MARYDYRCPRCETVFEVEHPMSEHPLVTCPSCGAEAERVFSASGISFQGSGFYNTDNRSGGSGGKCAHCSGGDCANC
ncbi:MAG: FmdB family transcriptional regulator [Olsenella sp.]|nr:FmdB family transcriptional regulator [Olsenella sp.]